MKEQPEHTEKLDKAEKNLGHEFSDRSLLLTALTHPSAAEGHSISDSYERLEFLGDSILGAIVSYEAYHAYPNLDEGGLTRIKVSLVSGASLSEVGKELGLADCIFFGSSERGTGRRGLHSALENVYESLVASLFLDGGIDAAASFVKRTLIVRMSEDMAKEPKTPKASFRSVCRRTALPQRIAWLKRRGRPMTALL